MLNYNRTWNGGSEIHSFTSFALLDFPSCLPLRSEIIINSAGGESSSLPDGLSSTESTMIWPPLIITYRSHKAGVAPCAHVIREYAKRPVGVFDIARPLSTIWLERNRNVNATNWSKCRTQTYVLMSWRTTGSRGNWIY